VDVDWGLDVVRASLRFFGGGSAFSIWGPPRGYALSQFALEFFARRLHADARPVGALHHDAESPAVFALVRLSTDESASVYAG